MDKYNASVNPFKVVPAENYLKVCMPVVHDEDIVMPDFNIIATLKECPEEAKEELILLDEDSEKQDKIVEDIKNRQVVRSVKNALKMFAPNKGSCDEDEGEGISEDKDVTYTVVWEKPYTSPTSALKKPNAAVKDKPRKSVSITPPPSHKAGYHPVRTQGGAVYLRRRDQKAIMKKIRLHAEKYLFDAVLAQTFYNHNNHLTPMSPLGLLNLPSTYLDFVVIVNSGPEEFFVRIGQLDVRRKFNYMEQEMKQWYTKKEGLMNYCASRLQDAVYLGYYVMFHERFGEFLRIQISSPVEYNVQKNPNGMVVVALIDYGGHLYTRVRQLLPLMPYFALFPKMALRGILKLTPNLKKNTGRPTYTSKQESVFRNLIADYNGMVEAVTAVPDDNVDLKEYDDDNGTFDIVQLVLFVMSNGHRKNVDEILLGSPEQQNVYLREPSHYPSVKEYREEREDSLSPLKANVAGSRIMSRFVRK